MVSRVWVAARGRWGSSVPVACIERTVASDRGWYRWRYCMGAVKHGVSHARFPVLARAYTLELAQLPAPLHVPRDVLAREGAGDELATLALTGGVSGPSPWEVYPVQREAEGVYELRFYLRPLAVARGRQAGLGEWPEPGSRLVYQPTTGFHALMGTLEPDDIRLPMCAVYRGRTVGYLPGSFHGVLLRGRIEAIARRRPPPMRAPRTGGFPRSSTPWPH